MYNNPVSECVASRYYRNISYKCRIIFFIYILICFLCRVNMNDYMCIIMLLRHSNCLVPDKVK